MIYIHCQATGRFIFSNCRLCTTKEVGNRRRLIGEGGSWLRLVVFEESIIVAVPNECGRESVNRLSELGGNAERVR